jgi:hypothetical protein
VGAYFRCYREKGLVKKTLIKKVGGSSYPKFEDFSLKMENLKKYLGDFVAETELNYDGKRIRLKQEKVEGEDIFDFLSKQGSSKLKSLKFFLNKLDELYKKTGMLPDFLNKVNILVSVNYEIKIVDVWPLFFEERIKVGDINLESYKENLSKFATLKNYSKGISRAAL